MFEYLSLATTAFLSATLLPMGSEVLLMYYATDAQLSLVILWLVASLANTLGAVVNWALGYYFSHYQDRKWFPLNPSQWQRSQDLFRRYGYWSLLLLWLPVVGDPLGCIAGLMKTPLYIFFGLAFIGKAMRYGVLLWGVEGFVR